MTPVHRRLTFRMLAPIAGFGLALGVVSMGSLYVGVSEFVERQAASDLRWRSTGVHYMIDSNYGELQRAGKSGNPAAVRRRKVDALLAIDDFARVNALRVTVHDAAAQRTVGVGMDPTAVAAGSVDRWLAGGGRRYTDTFYFEPWRWEVTLAQDDRAYMALFRQLLVVAGISALIFVAGITGFLFYLSTLVRAPIRKIIDDLALNRPPKYKGIAEFEYLTRSISNMMDAIREQSRMLEATFANIGEGLCVFDGRMNSIAWNAKFLELYGLSRRAGAGRGEITAALRGAIEIPPNDLAEQIRDERTFEHVRPNGRIIEVRVNPLGDQRYVSTHEDITERKAAETRIRHLATHDVLTNQPNRFLFQDRLHQAVAAARRTGNKGGVLLIDLDRFKDVNDTLGHEVGDQLLQESAARIASVIRESDTVARFGGDEFGVLVPVLDKSDDLAQIAEKLIALLSDPFSNFGVVVHIGASIGITVFPEDGVDPTQLLRNADIALYEAKGAGRGQYRFFTETLNARVQERAGLTHDLRGALERNELTLSFQPQIDLTSQAMIGVEALVRWQHPTRGKLDPASFIPLAEHTGHIVPIGEWVLRRACEQTGEWLKRGVRLRMSVNVSAVQVRRGDILRSVQQALVDYNVPPELLELEITESAFLDDPDTTIAIFRRLREMGVQISLDDFGTGYSSLSYLRRLPLTNIKIDHSFVRDMNERTTDATIVRGIIDLAHGLGAMRVIAEGIENRTQYQTLRDMHCDEGQGFFLCAPVAAEKIVEFQTMGLAHTGEMPFRSTTQ